MTDVQIEHTYVDEAWLKDLPPDFLMCRSIRHQWDLADFRTMTAEEAREVSKPAGIQQMILRELTCLRCPTIRQDFFGRTTRKKLNGGPFSKLFSRYKYPRGYTFVGKEHDLERPSMEDYHRETFRRWGDQ